MSKFCHNCGKQMPSVSAKFCPFCGTSLASLSATPTPAPTNTPRQTFTPFMADGDEDSEYIDRIQHLDVKINKLEFDFKVPHLNNIEVLGNIAAKEANPYFEPRGQMTPEAAMKEFTREASSLRPND